MFKAGIVKFYLFLLITGSTVFANFPNRKVKAALQVIRLNVELEQLKAGADLPITDSNLEAFVTLATDRTTQALVKESVVKFLVTKVKGFPKLLAKLQEKILLKPAGGYQMLVGLLQREEELELENGELSKAFLQIPYTPEKLLFFSSSKIKKGPTIKRWLNENWDRLFREDFQNWFELKLKLLGGSLLDSVEFFDTGATLFKALASDKTLTPKKKLELASQVICKLYSRENSNFEERKRCLTECFAILREVFSTPDLALSSLVLEITSDVTAVVMVTDSAFNPANNSHVQVAVSLYVLGIPDACFEMFLDDALKMPWSLGSSVEHIKTAFKDLISPACAKSLANNN